MWDFLPSVCKSLAIIVSAISFLFCRSAINQPPEPTVSVNSVLFLSYLSFPPFCVFRRYEKRTDPSFDNDKGLRSVPALIKSHRIALINMYGFLFVRETFLPAESIYSILFPFLYGSYWSVYLPDEIYWKSFIFVSLNCCDVPNLPFTF